MPPAAPAMRSGASTTSRVVAVVAALLLAACASKPPESARSTGATPVARPPMPTAPAPVAAATGPMPARDGPEAQAPPDLERVPDAEPVLEPIRNGGPNKPYDAAGQSYVPITKDAPFVERGLASWYGRKFHGRRTASGELYNMYAMTAAHKTLPIPSYARVRNPANGAEVVVRVNDRGPFVAGRIVDLSYTAALKLGLLRGVAHVEVERITFDDIRTGAWRRDAASAVASASMPTPPDTAPAATPPATAAPATASPAEALADPAAPAVDVAPPLAAPPVATAAPGSEPGGPAQRSPSAPAHGFWVQLGAFKERNGAEQFHRRVSSAHDWLAPMLAVFVDHPLFRLQAGPYPSREEARGAAEQIRAALQLVPLILERR